MPCQMTGGSVLVDAAQETMVVLTFGNNREIGGRGLKVGVVVGIGLEKGAKDKMIYDVRKVVLPTSNMHIGIDRKTFLVGKVKRDGRSVGVVDESCAKHVSNPMQCGNGPWAWVGLSCWIS